MSEKQNEAVLSIFPANATTGALSVFVRPDKVEWNEEAIGHQNNKY
jgi:hypothetical protein